MLLHHQFAVGQRIVLRPVHRADVVLEVLRALRQVREVLVRQVDHPLAHVVLCQLDEKGAEAIAHATRSRVQQEPDVLVLIEADLDEMVPRAQRPEVIDALHMIQLRILVDDRLDTPAPSSPTRPRDAPEHRDHAPRSFFPPLSVRPCGTAFSIAVRMPCRLSGS